MTPYLKTQIELTVALIINDALSSGITTIEFLKEDSSIRSMRATIDAKLIPSTEQSSTVKAIDLDVVKVFDVEKKAWRSFRIDRLKSIAGIDVKTFLTSYFEDGL